jgi:hypothetical protein
VNDETTLSNTGVFAVLGTPHLPPGPQMVAEAAASAQMLEDDRRLEAEETAHLNSLRAPDDTDERYPQEAA